MQNDNVDDTTSLGGAPKEGAYSGDDAIAAAAKAAAEQKVQSIDEQLGNVPKKVAEKIKACDNILVALSNDPNVDEISAAIGLTMILNKLGKHVTAIYSGETPNTLEFLRPEETFEKNTNSLQDFIIALSKDKADHLRYKVEGDYVKVYITPYKTTISEQDFEFSQGDFNVDLVIAIDVDNADVLDAALEEYGRIMHDATAINITTNQAGRFAELEWSDPSMSSVCEMIVNLSEYLEVTEFDQPIATALLTGIVSATERFSNARTTSETMQISSRLMQAGADQQLISSNIMKPEEEKKEEEQPEPVPETPAAPEVPAAPLEPLIPAPSLAPAPEPVAPAPVDAPEQPAPVAAPASTPEQQLEQMVAAPTAATGMPEALATELANATPEAPAEPVAPEIPSAPAAVEVPKEPEILIGTPAPEPPKPAPSLEPAGAEGLAAPTTVETEPVQQTMTLPGQASQNDVQAAMNDILNPATPTAPEEKLPQIVSQGSVMAQNVAEPVAAAPDYGAMIDQALTEAANAPVNPATQAAPVVPTQADDAASLPNMQFDVNATPAAMMNPVPEAPAEPVAPVAPAAPEAPANPVEVPSNIDIELPPPPAPNIDMTMAGMPPVIADAPAPAAPEVPAAPTKPVAPETPAAPATAEVPSAYPSAFQIPQA